MLECLVNACIIFFQSKIFWCTQSAEECSIGAFPLSLPWGDHPYVRLGQFPAELGSYAQMIKSSGKYLFLHTYFFHTPLVGDGEGGGYKSVSGKAQRKNTFCCSFLYLVWENVTILHLCGKSIFRKQNFLAWKNL